MVSPVFVRTLSFCRAASVSRYGMDLCVVHKVSETHDLLVSAGVLGYSQVVFEEEK